MRVKYRPLPSIEDCRKLGYDPETGNFSRQFRQHSYWHISVTGISCPAHRAAWAVMTGAWPTKHIDHINCVGTDNRWCNLREATTTQNLQNSRVTKKSKSGIKGVHPTGRKNKPWGAYICVDKKRKGLGRFETVDEAAAAYWAAAQKYFGEFARP